MNCYVLVQENLEVFHLLRCVSLISGILQSVAKMFKKYMEVNHFLLLSCSLKRWLLVEWFFNYSTHRPGIVLLSTLVVLFQGNVLRWGQIFLEEIFLWGNFHWGKFSSKQLFVFFPRSQLSWNQTRHKCHEKKKKKKMHFYLHSPFTVKLQKIYFKLNVCNVMQLFK